MQLREVYIIYDLYTVVNEDFQLPNPLYTIFMAGTTCSGDVQCLYFSIINDMVFEGDKQTFNVAITGTTLNVNFDVSSEAEVCILEDDDDSK